MLLRAGFWLCLLLGSAALAQAWQPSNTADGGWLGPLSAFYCPGCDANATGVLFEARLPTETYAQTGYQRRVAFGQAVVDKADLMAGGRFAGGLVYHLALIDQAGATLGAFTPELAAQGDVQCDQAGGEVTVVNAGGSLTLSVSPGLDSQSGIASYGYYVQSGPGSVSAAYLGVSSSTTLVTSFGPGTWLFCADATDGVGNYCPTVTCTTTSTIVTSTVGAPPAAPVPTQPAFRDGVLTLSVPPVAAGEHLHAMSLFPDGGVIAGPPRRLDPTDTELRGFLGGCTVGLRTRVSSLTPAGVTPWSAWSTPYDLDPSPPTAVASLQFTRTAADRVLLSWSPASDSCTSVASHRLRVVSPAMVETTVSSVSSPSDVALPAEGTWLLGVSALDLAGNVGPEKTVSVVVGVLDAGVDAGPADAGAPDAGRLDAGAPDAGTVPSDAGRADGGSPSQASGLIVGCGCAHGSFEGLSVGFLIWVVCRRRSGALQTRR